MFVYIFSSVGILDYFSAGPVRSAAPGFAAAVGGAQDCAATAPASQGKARGY